MATNIVRTITTNPTLWSAYRHELFKGRKQRFYLAVLVLPLIITLILVIFQLVWSLLDPPAPGIPTSQAGTVNLGTQGGFAVANNIILAGFAALYGIFVAIAAALSVANEYRWGTLKMLVIRQPNRAKVVLAKCLFTLSLVVGVAVAFLIGWFLFGLFEKICYKVPLEISRVDLEVMGKGLYYFTVSNLQTLILALFAVAMTFLFRSVVAGVIGYMLYSFVDGGCSNMGAGAINSGIDSAPALFKPILGLLEIIHPFLLTSSINRLTMSEFYSPFGAAPGMIVPNPQIVTSMPIWWAWLLLVIYLIVFTALALWFFIRRDIKD
jgi:ABC-type transport system involved in multi-copper enzyme maturation permease subunit